MSSIPALHFVEALRASVNNDRLSDQQFRRFNLNSLPLVNEPDPTAPLREPSQLMPADVYADVLRDKVDTDPSDKEYRSFVRSTLAYVETPIEEDDD